MQKKLFLFKDKRKGNGIEIVLNDYFISTENICHGHKNQELKLSVLITEL